MINISAEVVKHTSVIAEHIRARVQNMDEEVDKKLKALVDEAVMVARAGYALAGEYGVENRVNVYSDQDKELYGDSYFIIAHGKDVAFLEFGAGFTTDISHPWKHLMDFDVRPGSWSETHARQFADHGFWFYNGTSYSYIPPTRAMYNASEYMKQKIQTAHDQTNLTNFLLFSGKNFSSL